MRPRHGAGAQVPDDNELRRSRKANEPDPRFSQARSIRVARGPVKPRTPITHSSNFVLEQRCSGGFPRMNRTRRRPRCLDRPANTPAAATRRHRPTRAAPCGVRRNAPARRVHRSTQRKLLPPRPKSASPTAPSARLRLLSEPGRNGALRSGRPGARRLRWVRGLASALCPRRPPADARGAGGGGDGCRGPLVLDRNVPRLGRASRC